MKNTLCLLFLILLACSDEDPTPFTGITMTDEFANPIGEVDPSDWLTNENWTTQEVGLFPDYQNLDYNNKDKEPKSGSSHWIGYPNPTVKRISILFEEIEEVSRGELVVVNPNFEVLHRSSFTSAQKLNLDFTDNSLQAQLRNLKGINRVYYIYQLVNDEFFYKGHGDFIIDENFVNEISGK